MNFVPFDTQLYDAVFGGPRPSEALILRSIAEAKLMLPSLVIVFPHGEQPTSDEIVERVLAVGGGVLAGARHRVIELPPAGNFWFLPLETSLDSQKACLDRPERLVAAMQAAILEQRHRDLEALGDVGPIRRFTHQEEMEAFAMALQEALRGGAGKAVAIWSRMVLQRHQGQINAVRLRWVEFLTALTRGTEANVAYITYSFIRMIYQEHSLPKLGQLPARIVSELVPLLAGRQGGVGAGRHPALARVFAYMEEHFTEQIGLAEVAAAVHISAAHLARLFRRETGQTIVGVLQRLRIQRACELLATTDQTLLEVAYDSGFESVEHFHRLFRRQCGVTPSVYRRTHHR